MSLAIICLARDIATHSSRCQGQTLTFAGQRSRVPPQCTTLYTVTRFLTSAFPAHQVSYSTIHRSTEQTTRKFCFHPFCGGIRWCDSHAHERIGRMSNLLTRSLISSSDGRFSKRLAALNILGRSCVSPAVIIKLPGNARAQCTDLSMASCVG